MARKSSPAKPRDYEVGKGKPPVDTQFKSGQSGNPDGRPKAAPDVNKKILAYAKKMTAVMMDGKLTKMAQLDVVVAALYAKAKKGDLGAAKLIFFGIQAAEAQTTAVARTLTAAQLAMLRELVPDLPDPELEPDPKPASDKKKR
jgi:hypothetical protein